jgi:hypothetical protein
LYTNEVATITRSVWTAVARLISHRFRTATGAAVYIATGLSGVRIFGRGVTGSAPSAADITQAGRPAVTPYRFDIIGGDAAFLMLRRVSWNNPAVRNAQG